ncbi:MAG: geranylgeranylglycerol-phosphate geranylgeranyltransferase [Prevotellaceae bacterium]|jgi:4-hydroxybenzoate polyprenyltransferase|nr:geranylgeranylglycerol-phosphate geranylgeranyltransferase [Prevotellaceae bacterium]
MFHLIRYRNLFFLVAIQWLIYYAIITPTLQMFAIAPQLPTWTVWALIAASVLIAAGGYVINDYFDLKIDRINRPERVIIGEKITKENAMQLYRLLTGAGVAAGLTAAVFLHNTTVGVIILMTTGLLWFYSASYKRQLIIGNLTVALVSALAPLLLLVAESAALSNNYSELLRLTPVLPTLYAWVCGFALYAFLWTFIREIIKDIEDEKGDREMECHTIPIVWGVGTAKIIVTVLTVLTVASLGAVAVWVIDLPGAASVSLRYWLFGIVLPGGCMLALLWSKSSGAIRQAGNCCKFIMLTGILYSLLYCFFIAKTCGLVLWGMFKFV